MAKAPNLAKLSLAELKALRKDIDQAISKAEKDKKKLALAEIEKAAQKHGFALSDLVGGKKRGSAKPAAAPKYRHPENAAMTWSGRGRQPAWFKEAIAGGKNPEDLAI